MFSVQDIPLWARRIRARYPKESAKFSSQQLELSLAGWIDLLSSLDIVEHEDQVRFLNLSVLITRDQRKSVLIQGVLKRIMSHKAWPPKARLDFIYKHVVGRPVREDELNPGSQFVPF